MTPMRDRPAFVVDFRVAPRVLKLGVRVVRHNEDYLLGIIKPLVGGQFASQTTQLVRLLKGHRIGPGGSYLNSEESS